MRKEILDWAECHCNVTTASPLCTNLFIASYSSFQQPHNSQKEQDLCWRTRFYFHLGEGKFAGCRTSTRVLFWLSSCVCFLVLETEYNQSTDQVLLVKQDTVLRELSEPQCLSLICQAPFREGKKNKKIHNQKKNKTKQNTLQGPSGCLPFFPP